LYGNQQTSHIRCSVFQNFKVITLSGAARKASGGMRPGKQILGGASTHLIQAF